MRPRRSAFSATIGYSRGRLQRAWYSSFQRAGKLLGVLLVALEDLEPGLQQAFKFRVVRRGNERRLERVVDGLVEGDLVVHVRLVERRAVHGGQLRPFRVRLLDQEL